MKITVGDFKRFQQDKNFWAGKYYTSPMYLIDGETTDDLDEGIHPDIEIQIVGGTVWHDSLYENKHSTLLEFFLKWRQQNQTNKNEKESYFSLSITPTHVLIPIKLDVITQEIHVYVDDDDIVKAKLNFNGEYSKSEIKALINGFQVVLSALEQMEKKNNG